MNPSLHTNVRERAAFTWGFKLPDQKMKKLGKAEENLSLEQHQGGVP